MTYIDTFIQVAPDCPVTEAIFPEAKKGRKPIHMIQHELLTQDPYTYNHKDLIFEVHIRHKDLLTSDPGEIREELFRKPHPCMRASALPKKYGWGVHYNAEGKMALYAMESSEYRSFIEDENITVLNAMRSKRVK